MIPHKTLDLQDQTWYRGLKTRYLGEKFWLIFVDKPFHWVYLIGGPPQHFEVLKVSIAKEFEAMDTLDAIDPSDARRHVDNCVNGKRFFVPLSNDSPSFQDPAPIISTPQDDERLKFFKGQDVTHYGAIPSAEEVLILDEGFGKVGKGQGGYKLAELGDGWRWGTYGCYFYKDGGGYGGQNIKVGMPAEKSRMAAIAQALECLRKRFAVEDGDLQYRKFCKRVLAAVDHHAAELGIELTPALPMAQDPAPDRPLPSPALSPAAAGIARTCPACRELFTSRSKGAIYCSDTCRLRGHRHRKHGAPLPASPPPARDASPALDPRKALNMQLMDVKAGQLYGWSVKYAPSVAKYTVAVAHFKLDAKHPSAVYAQGVGRDAMAACQVVADMLYLLATTFGREKEVVGALRKEMGLPAFRDYHHHDSSYKDLGKDLRLLGMVVTRGMACRVFIPAGEYKTDLVVIVPHEGIYNIRAFFNNETVQVSVASTDFVEATELLFERLLKYKIPIKPYEKSET